MDPREYLENCLFLVSVVFLRYYYISEIFWRSVPLPPLFEPVPVWVTYGESPLLLGCVTQNKRLLRAKRTVVRAR